jgi:hypothetical protein
MDARDALDWPHRRPRRRNADRGRSVLDALSVQAAAVAAALCAVTCVGCAQDPGAAYARQLQRAASWSASLQFAGECARAGKVPHTYMRDLIATAAREVDAITRQTHDAACGRLSELLRDAGSSPPPDATLRELERTLRTEAAAVRSRP